MTTTSVRLSLVNRIFGSLRYTFPIAKDVLRHYKRTLLGMILIGVILGIVPTLKSELESGVVNEINDYIRGESLSFSEPISRFQKDMTSRADSTDYSLAIANWLFGGANLAKTLIYYFLLTLAAYLVGVLAKYIQTLISRDIFARLRSQALKKGLVTDPRNISSLPNAPGQYTNAIQQGASNFWGTYGYLLDSGQYLFSLFATLFLLLSKNWVFGISCLGIVLAQAWISVVQAKRLKEGRNKLDEKRNELVGRTDDILSKREIILAYEQQKKYEDKLDKMTIDYANIDRKLEIKGEWFQGFSNLVTDYGRLLVLLAGLFAAFALGKSSISNIGDAYFLISIYIRILDPATNLLRKYDDFKRSEATSQSFLDILNSTPRVIDVETASTVSNWDGHDGIRFEKVFFKYHEKGKCILENCSFRVPANATTMVLGRSGSGKSTISRIILGFWPLTAGEVFIHGRSINEWNTEKLREKMSYVSQGDHIIDDTVRENISWGYAKNGVAESDMIEALRAVKIPIDFLDKPAKDLSLGQQQRLSFARMLLDESDIVILDEPFSGVDIFTIGELRNCLIKEFTANKRTVLMFSHRLAFAAYADHIVVLGDNGAIAEQGSPKELIESGGTFATLYKAALDELTLDTASSAV